MMTTRSESDYYNLIEAPGRHLIVMGDQDEQWTGEVLRCAEEEGVRVDFIPWREAADLRVQLELVYYPAVQLWVNGRLEQELSGYHCESLKRLIHSM